MARLSCEKRAELESFWRSHHEEWERSTLNQREYCEAHGLPLKRFGNWRAMFKTETAAVQANLLYRRGGSLRHMASHMSDKEIAQTSTGYVPSVKSMPEGRRNFRMADKKRIVAEATRMMNIIDIRPAIIASDSCYSFAKLLRAIRICYSLRLRAHCRKPR